MNVQTKDYNGNCRRNGGKLRLSGLDWFRIGKWSLTIIILATVTAVTLKLNVNAIAESAAENKAAIKLNGKKDAKRDVAIAKMQIQLENIAEDVDDIKPLIIKMAIKMQVKDD